MKHAEVMLAISACLPTAAGFVWLCQVRMSHRGNLTPRTRSYLSLFHNLHVQSAGLTLLREGACWWHLPFHVLGILSFTLSCFNIFSKRRNNSAILNLSISPKQFFESQNIDSHNMTSTDPSAKVLNDFHYFPKLPIEIRSKIWRLLEPNPTILTDRNDHVAFQNRSKCLKSRRQETHFFITCKEVRLEFTLQNSGALDAIRKQKPMFVYRRVFEGERGIFVDWKNDIIDVSAFGRSMSAYLITRLTDYV